MTPLLKFGASSFFHSTQSAFCFYTVEMDKEGVSHYFYYYYRQWYNYLGGGVSNIKYSMWMWHCSEVWVSLSRSESANWRFES